MAWQFFCDTRFFPLFSSPRLPNPPYIYHLCSNTLIVNTHVDEECHGWSPASRLRGCRFRGQFWIKDAYLNRRKDKFEPCKKNSQEFLELILKNLVEGFFDHGLNSTTVLCGRDGECGPWRFPSHFKSVFVFFQPRQVYTLCLFCRRF